jgi:hypothetical protein
MGKYKSVPKDAVTFNWLYKYLRMHKEVPKNGHARKDSLASVGGEDKGHGEEKGDVYIDGNREEVIISSDDQDSLCTSSDNENDTVEADKNEEERGDENNRESGEVYILSDGEEVERVPEKSLEKEGSAVKGKVHIEIEREALCVSISEDNAKGKTVSVLYIYIYIYILLHTNIYLYMQLGVYV